MALSPQDQNLVSKYRLLPRRKGLGSHGERLSHQQGMSSEFRDYREYGEGDDLRHLDWNVLARLGTRVVRTYQDEQELKVTLTLDGTASMVHEGSRKWQTTQQLAAALGSMALLGGDHLQAYVIGPDGGIQNLRGQSATGRWLRWLSQSEPANEGSSFRKGCEAVANRLGQPGLSIVISDGLEIDAEEGIRSFVRRQQEVWWLQVLDPSELNPELYGDLEMVDVDSGQSRVCTITEAVRREYLNQLEAHCQIISEGVTRGGGRAMRIVAGTPIASVLRDNWRPQRWVG